jgi:hypothetical protein
MASIIITNYNGLLDLEAYLRRRYRLTTRSRSSDVGSRMESLGGFVKTTSGRECITEFETVMRVLPRIAILSNPWLQTAEEVLTASIELYEELVQQMPYLKFMESGSEFKTYYRKLSMKGKVMNSSFFSRRYMKCLDLPIANITTELMIPSIAGVSRFIDAAIYEKDLTEDQEDIYTNTKNSLSADFSNSDIEFNYEQMFQHGRFTTFGKNHRNPKQ